MTKAELIAKIASQTGLEKSQVSVVIESFMVNVKDSLVNNQENVYLRGFGSFNIKHRAAKTGRNISKNTTIDIPAHNIPYFKPANEFIDAMAEASSSI